MGWAQTPACCFVFAFLFSLSKVFWEFKVERHEAHTTMVILLFSVSASMVFRGMDSGRLGGDPHKWVSQIAIYGMEFSGSDGVESFTLMHGRCIGVYC